MQSEYEIKIEFGTEFKELTSYTVCSNGLGVN